MKSGQTLLESPAGMWYLQVLHVLSQVMLLRKSLAQEKTQHEGRMPFHPLPSPQFSSGSSEIIGKKKKKHPGRIIVTLTLFATELKKKKSQTQKPTPLPKSTLVFCFYKQRIIRYKEPRYVN